MENPQTSQEIQKAALEDLRDIWTRLAADYRKARRNLLLSSAIGTFIAITGVTPTKIETVGIELRETPDLLFFSFVIVIILYFLWSFIHYNSRSLKLHSESRSGEHIKNMLGDYYDVYLNYRFFFGPKYPFRAYWFYCPCFAAGVSIVAMAIRIGLIMNAGN